MVHIKVPTMKKKLFRYLGFTYRYSLSPIYNSWFILGAHLSITLQGEIGLVPLKKLQRVKRDYAGRPVIFSIKDFDITYHREKSGDCYWLAQFDVQPTSILKVREKLNLKYQDIYRPHIVVLESKINKR